MIGRVYPLGRGFKGLVSYLETGKDGRQKPRDRVDWVAFRNLPTCNARTAACMMAATASESVSGTRTAVYHFSVSCDPGDPVDPGTLRHVADRVIRDLGLEEHEVLIFAHKDKAHPHLHFVVNRVHPERRTLWRPWRDYPRIERSLRAQEQELGLQIVPGWNSVVVRDVDGGLRVPAEHETGLQRVYPPSNPRRGDAEFLREVTARAAPVLEQARSWAELERGLAEQGLSLRVKGGGFTLTDGTRQVKASEIGRECSRYHLEKRLGAYPDYRARVAVAQIAPAPRAPVVQPQVAPSRESTTVEAQAPARQEPPGPALPPATQVPPRVEGRVPQRRRPQFGDAGHGIIELFGSPPTPEVERPVPAVERAPTPQPQRKERTFLREVQERAGPVLERAGTWVELLRGLADQGLSLREKGGGFVVTDGEQEVKASEVGRAFSRFHLEKRLGQYPSSRARGAVDEIQPAPPAPAVEPNPAGGQAEQLALPLPPPAVQEGARTPARPTQQRFTLYDDGTVFGVRDRDGQVFFAETRERAVAEVERANAITALYPAVISMRHLREMDDAWRDARGLPRLPEPEGRRITVPAPEGLGDSLPAPPPVARVQPEAPTPASAAPESVSPSQPIRGPEPTQPARRAVAATPVVPQPPAPAAPEVRRPAPPRRTRSQPPTHRDNYREVVWNFRQKLAELYRDPRAARRAFDVELGRHGAESAVRVLAEAPEQYGKLRILARRERIVAAVPWAELYADWQRGSTRPARYAAADLLEAAALPFWISDARAQVHAARHEHTMLPKRIAAADAVEADYALGLKLVYADPTAAELKIDAHCQLHGVNAAVKAIEESPRLFGALRPNEGQSWISRQWNGPDTSAARERAKILAEEFRAAQVAVRERPTSDALFRARTAIVDAERFAEALEAKLAALPHKSFTVYAAEALRVIDQAAAATGRSVDRIVDQVRPMLPKEAIQFARKALDAVVRQQEREQRNQGIQTHGFDI